MTDLGFAFFDDYPYERGHHPDLIIGLGMAAKAPVYCPDRFFDGRPHVAGLSHRVGVTGGSVEQTRANLERSCADAASLGRDVFINLFLDENWDSYPVHSNGMKVVHALHRPGELTGELGGVNATKAGDALQVLRRMGEQDLVVVHTPLGEKQALQWLPQRNVLRTGWPAAHRELVKTRLAQPWTGGDSEPYVLLIGEALDYKGLPCLLEAVSNGPPLHIGGNLTFGGPAWLAEHFPSARVTWEPGWISRARMDALITRAAVVAFPYLEEFANHGGASGALVDALTFGKPIVISEALAAQTTVSDSCRVVPVGDADALRRAIGYFFSKVDDIHAAARDLAPFLLREHTYEGHLEQLADRLSQ